MNTMPLEQQILHCLQIPPSSLPSIRIDDSRSQNAGRCMTELICNRLSHEGDYPRRLRHTTFEWKGGIVAVRNSRVAEHHWSTAQDAVVQQLHELAKERPVVYLLLHWDLDACTLDAWAVPEAIGWALFTKLPAHSRRNSRTVQISPKDHLLKDAMGSPNLSTYYTRTLLSAAEQAKLLEAIKTDEAIKQERRDTTGNETAFGVKRGGETAGVLPMDDPDDEVTSVYSEDTVAFLQELTEHTEDAEWHSANKRRYELLLRDPTRVLVEELRTRYIQRLNPAVASGKRPLSVLRKNDYGKGGFYDYYWFAFYDPAAGSKTKSAQLFAALRGDERVWRYGLVMGDYCDTHHKQLTKAISAQRQAVADYVRQAPKDTLVRFTHSGISRDLTPTAFADWITHDNQNAIHDVADLQIVRNYPLATLADRAEHLADEIGSYFTWAWPFFEAAMTGIWNTDTMQPRANASNEEEAGDVDENAPQSISELAAITALPTSFLSEVEDALFAKRQVILVGPPGTSKTYIARQFARYFTRQRPGQPQGCTETLYMHANWGYEDFFEGLKPTSKDGALSFEPRLGFFLEWVARLRDYSPKARHVLVLDEINRCDTAAVLGELLQLLEYRDTTVPLLSGRRFTFPGNVFIIGTMNSADRSIGRLDLALQRRFHWLNLHPQPETLNTWLGRPGNNPLGFQASALEQCNELLAEQGIPPEQHIGHALFMLQRTAEDDDVSPKLDTPLSERNLRQIVRFSVVPYVRELLAMQFGQASASLLQQISDILLRCVSDNEPASPKDQPNGRPSN